MNASFLLDELEAVQGARRGQFVMAFSLLIHDWYGSLMLVQICPKSVLGFLSLTNFISLLNSMNSFVCSLVRFLDCSYIYEARMS